MTDLDVSSDRRTPAASDAPSPFFGASAWPAALAVAAGLIALVVILLSQGMLAGRGDDGGLAASVVLGCAAVGGLFTAVFRPRWVLYGFIFAAILFHEIIEFAHVPLGFMKLYITDAVFAFNLAFIAGRALFGIFHWPALPLNRFVAAYLVLGFWGIANGWFLSGNAHDEVLGDFRRAFLYFSNYFVILLLCDSWREVRTLKKLVLVASMALVAKAFFQAGTGQFYYRRAGDAAHVLSQYEIIFITISLYYALARIVLSTDRRAWWLVYAAAAIVAIILANYRAGWLGTMGGLAFLFLTIPGRNKVRLAMLALLGAAFVSTAVLLMWEVPVTEGRSTVGQELVQKANVKQTTEDINVLWRFASYSAAIDRWMQRPLLGAGLGTYVEFYAPTSTGGSLLAEGHNIHNSMLWILMTQGLLGFAVIMALHTAFLLHAVRFMRRTRWTEGRVFVTAAAAYYAAMMVATCFENFLEHATPITVFSTMMALAMLVMHHEPVQAETPVKAD